MDKEAIFKVIKEKTLMILPDVSEDQLTRETRLKDLGANSVDRVEVVIYTMEELGLSVPRVKFHGAENLGDLVEIFSEYVNEKR